LLDDACATASRPGRITTAAWNRVVKTAHSVGLTTNVALDVRHVESDAERHLPLERAAPHSEGTGGFIEFVPGRS